MARRHGNGELRVAVREGVGKGSGEGCRQLALKRLYEGVPPAPVGVALGIVDVVGCRPMKREDLVAACCEDYEDEM